MIKEISKKFDRELALKPRLRNQEQRVDQYHSHLRGRDKWLHLQMKKIIQYRRFKNVTLYTHLTRKDFIDLWEKAGGTAGEGIGPVAFLCIFHCFPLPPIASCLLLLPVAPCCLPLPPITSHFLKCSNIS